MSFNVKLKNVEFSCAPMLVEGFNGKNEVIAYKCDKKEKVVEKFASKCPANKVSDFFQMSCIDCPSGQVPNSDQTLCNCQK